MELLNQFTEWADKFTIWVALFTLLFTIKSWLADRKNNIDISIKLQHAQHAPLMLAQTIKRRHFTRSEVQGVLANAYHNPNNTKTRYKIPFLASKEFSNRLELVQNGKTDILIIDIEDKNEFEFFVSQ